MDTNFNEKTWKKKKVQRWNEYKISNGNNHLWNDKENELCVTYFIKNENNNNANRIEIRNQTIIK